MHEIIFGSLIVFFASTLQALTGFGFAITATPLLLLLFNSRDSIQMSILLSFFIAVILIPRIRREADFGMFRRLAAGSLLGVPVGLALFSVISLDALKITISVVILAITSFSLANWYKNRDGRPASPPAALSNPSPRLELLAGFLAGLLTASIGMPGVPLVLYFITVNTPKEIVRSTTLAFFCIVYVVSILAQTLTVKIGAAVLLTSLKLVPAATLGVIVGHRLFPKIRQSLFQLITNIILIITALYIIAGVCR